MSLSAKKSSFDIYNSKLLGDAADKKDKLRAASLRELNRKLRLKYNGKIVECNCFDAWCDGDDRYFKQKLIDINVGEHSDGSYYITVSFMVKSIYSKPKDKPSKCSYYLESIESVK